MKRLLSLACSLLLIISLFSFSCSISFADDLCQAYCSREVTVNDYDILKYELENATTNTLITLDNNINLSNNCCVNIAPNCTVILETNGHSISISDKIDFFSAFNISNNTDFYIINSSSEKSIITSNNDTINSIFSINGDNSSLHILGISNEYADGFSSNFLINCLSNVAFVNNSRASLIEINGVDIDSNANLINLTGVSSFDTSIILAGNSNIKSNSTVDLFDCDKSFSNIKLYGCNIDNNSFINNSTSTATLKSLYGTVAYCYCEDGANANTRINTLSSFTISCDVIGDNIARIITPTTEYRVDNLNGYSLLSNTKHSLNYLVTLEPTCINNGVERLECSTCSYYKENVISSLGHSYVNGACIRCNDIDINYKDINSNYNNDISSADTGNNDSKIDNIDNYLSNNTLQDNTLSPNVLNTVITDIAEPENSSQDSISQLESTILSSKSDDDFKGSVYATLMLKQAKITKNSIKLSWNGIDSADGYIIYSAKCGNKFKKVKSLPASKNSCSIKKLKKGTYYKFVVVAYKNTQDNKQILSTSKTIHIATDGGKYGNPKAIKLSNVKNNKLTLKKGSKYNIKASVVKAKNAIKKHTDIKYESSNKRIATVNSNGKITAKAKGKCNIYVYAQNGVSKKISIIVK